MQDTFDGLEGTLLSNLDADGDGDFMEVREAEAEAEAEARLPPPCTTWHDAHMRLPCAVAERGMNEWPLCGGPRGTDARRAVC